MLGTDNDHSSGTLNAITVRNNLFEDVSRANWGGDGRFMVIGAGAVNVTIDHNTALQDGTSAVLESGDVELEDVSSAEELLGQAREGDYVCIQAFVEPNDENDRRLGDLVTKLRRRSGLVVTHGYGPRYLHSTGQLHKGGPNTGLFLQVVDDTGEELPMPNRPFGFGRLIRAQAAGDYASLKERGRRVARVRLEDL